MEVTSVGLEGERISTQGMVLHLTRATALDEDSRAVGMALKLLAVIRRPGDPFAAPLETLRRIEAAAAPIGQVRDPGDRLEDAELPLIMEAARPWLHVPILAAWRAAATYAHRTRRSSPAAERLVFMTVEAAARHLRGLSPEQTADLDGRREGGAGVLLLPPVAGWIVSPSVALTRNGFRIWSPLTGLAPLLEATVRSLSQDLGHLGTLRHERARLSAMAATAHGRSRRADLVAYLGDQPVISSAMVMDHLGVTRPTALSLIGELVEAGCLRNLTARRAARFWALPSLAARMGQGGRTSAWQDAAAASGRVTGRAGLPVTSPAILSEDRQDQDRLERVMANLDAAMSGLDDLVRRVGEAHRNAK